MKYINSLAWQYLYFFNSYMTQWNSNWWPKDELRTLILCLTHTVYILAMMSQYITQCIKKLSNCDTNKQIEKFHLILQISVLLTAIFTTRHVRKHNITCNMVIDLLHKSHNALVPYPTMHHFMTAMCICVHISVTKWCIMGFLHDASWDLWDGSFAKVAHVLVFELTKNTS